MKERETHSKTTQRACARLRLSHFQSVPPKMKLVRYVCKRKAQGQRKGARGGTTRERPKRGRGPSVDRASERRGGAFFLKLFPLFFFLWCIEEGLGGGIWPFSPFFFSLFCLPSGEGSKGHLGGGGLVMLMPFFFVLAFL